MSISGIDLTEYGAWCIVYRSLRRCIVQELSTKMCCPVCLKVFFVRLHVEVD